MLLKPNNKNQMGISKVVDSDLILKGKRIQYVPLVMIL